MIHFSLTVYPEKSGDFFAFRRLPDRACSGFVRAAILFFVCVPLGFAYGGSAFFSEPRQKLVAEFFKRHLAPSPAE